MFNTTVIPSLPSNVTTWPVTTSTMAPVNVPPTHTGTLVFFCFLEVNFFLVIGRKKQASVTVLNSFFLVCVNTKYQMVRRPMVHECDNTHACMTSLSHHVSCVVVFFYTNKQPPAPPTQHNATAKQDIRQHPQTMRKLVPKTTTWRVGVVGMTVWGDQ